MQEKETKITGLTHKEVQDRVNQGLNNADSVPKQKSVLQIIRENVYSVFNLLNFGLGILVLSVGAFRNSFFLFVVFINLFIGIFNQIRARNMLEKLSLTSKVNATVIREGKEETISFEDVVMDDILCLSQGSAIPADCQVVFGSMEVEESFLTGEVDAVFKKAGDTVYSGTYVVSGSCYAKVIHVGKDNYASKVNEDAHRVKEEKSEIISALDKVIKTLTIYIIIFGTLLFLKSMFLLKIGYRDSLLSTTAAVIGMIPEGLILLTNVSLALGTMRLAKKDILVQQMYAIETLARVNLLCIDKTGTITDGTMKTKDIRYFTGNSEKYLSNLLDVTEDNNKTALAIREVLKPAEKPEFKEKIAFSSERKWSGAKLIDTDLVLGAPEIILKERKDTFGDLFSEIKSYQENGERVLVLLSGKDMITDNEGTYSIDTSGVQIEALIRITEHIREEANEIFEKFRQNGIAIKVISGDSAETVYHIARAAGAQINNNYIDVNDMSEEELRSCLDKNSVIGRVNPYQKRMIVEYYKEKGLTVAMTGDGVNDVPALRAADCGITLKSGSEAARTIAQIVLMDSKLSSIYNTILEGNIVINNIQRYATLFLIKTVFSTLLSFIFLFMPYRYPFQPIQLTLVGNLCLGIPSFLLTFERKYGKIEKNFIKYVASRALVGGIAITLFVVMATIGGNLLGFSTEKIATIAIIGAGIVGFFALFTNLKPFTILKGLMFAALLGAFAAALLFFRGVFYFAPIDSDILIAGAIYIVLTVPLHFIIEKLIAKKEIIK